MIINSPITELIAEVVLQRLKRVVFTVIPIKLWGWYVEDTLMIIKEDNPSVFQ